MAEAETPKRFLSDGDDDYPDSAHPLKTTNTVKKSLCKTRLKQLYDDAVKRKRVKNQEDWGRRVRNNNASKGLAQGWLKDPGRMLADDVYKTCRLFGCTIGYLRGSDNSTSDQNSYVVGKKIDRLTDRHQLLIAEVVECLSCAESELRNAKLADNAAAKLLAERDDEIVYLRKNLASRNDDLREADERYQCRLEEIARYKGMIFELRNENKRLRQELCKMREDQSYSKVS